MSYGKNLPRRVPPRRLADRSPVRGSAESRSLDRALGRGEEGRPVAGKEGLDRWRERDGRRVAKVTTRAKDQSDDTSGGSPHPSNRFLIKVDRSGGNSQDLWIGVSGNLLIAS